MSATPDSAAVPGAMDLAKIVKALGGTPSMYIPQGSTATETLTKAALATAAFGRAAKVAHLAQEELAATGDHQAGAALNHLLTVAMEEGDDRPEAVPLLWYWQVSTIAWVLRDMRTKAPQADPLIKASADTARALMILLEARLNLKVEHVDHLKQVLGEAEEMLTSARSNTARLPHWIKQPGNLD
ncbi:MULTISPECIES: hypothetical protein [unclassified Streptomyces]|uniref:hypothetical protein n=1 Tax=unclassified Streptomyces TaxID=2593676 RepID=UPI001BE90614|nr:MULTISPECIES: hypothetical protein [unclassified Streptomyces]MBT2405598.1 hypothetical protein [Streptomyces sp. ISL-21]MBT2607722.1 hypothetical protein [Streptomyces sp. ISL-87]